VNVASVVTLQLSVARIVIVCVPTGCAFEIDTTPDELTEIVPVYVPVFCTARVGTPPLSVGPVAGLILVALPTTTDGGLLYVSTGAVFAVTVTVNVAVAITPPLSVTVNVNVEFVAEQLAAT